MTVSEMAGTEGDFPTKPVILYPVSRVSDDGDRAQETIKDEKNRIKKAVTMLYFMTIPLFARVHR